MTIVIDAAGIFRAIVLLVAVVVSVRLLIWLFFWGKHFIIDSVDMARIAASNRREQRQYRARQREFIKSRRH